MGSVKPTFEPQYTEEFEHENIASSRQHMRGARMMESFRQGLTILSFLVGLVIVGTTANTLAVYNRTHTSDNALLPLWPTSFDLSPTISILAGGSVVVLAHVLSLVCSKIAALRHINLLHTAFILLAPSVSLVAAVISIAFFYSINASSTVDSIQSWSCSWQSLSLSTEPHFGSICREAKTGLYLTIALIPLQLLVLLLASMVIVSEKKSSRVAEMHDRKAASPTMS